MPESFIAVYVIGGIIAAVVILMSTFFLIKSVRRAKKIGMDKKVVKTAIKTSAVFSIVPSIPIVLGVGIMMSYLGLAIPWIRLTVVGALQYELIAMDQIGLTTASVITNQMIASALVIMTLGVLSGIIFNIFAYKKFQKKLVSLEKNNKKLLDTITGSLLSGLLAGLASYMIVAAFFPGVTGGENASAGVGYITLLTLLVSAVIMALCGFLMIKFKWKWVENYALPLTIVLSMVAAYGFTFIPAFA